MPSVIESPSGKILHGSPTGQGSKPLLPLVVVDSELPDDEPSDEASPLVESDSLVSPLCVVLLSSASLVAVLDEFDELPVALELVVELVLELVAALVLELVLGLVPTELVPAELAPAELVLAATEDCELVGVVLDAAELVDADDSDVESVDRDPLVSVDAHAEEHIAPRAHKPVKSGRTQKPMSVRDCMRFALAFAAD